MDENNKNKKRVKVTELNSSGDKLKTPNTSDQQNRQDVQKNKEELPEELESKSYGSDYRGKSSRTALVLFFSVAMIYVIYLITNLYSTTVINNDEFARAASSTQWKLISYSSDRGQIYDVNGNPLASNTYNYTVVCTPRTVAETEGIQQNRSQYITEITAILGIEYDVLDSKIPVNLEDESDPLLEIGGLDVCKNIDVETKELLEAYLDEHDIKGIGFVAVPQRYYNYSNLAAQIIGYATNNGDGLRGIYGLESYYNATLSGTNGYRYSEVDSSTDGVLPYSEATTEDAVDGNNLVLNMDINVQRIAEEACRSAYEQYNPRGGVCAIVMQPYTGAIMAMVSLPDYDLNNPYEMPYGMSTTDWMMLSEEEQIDYLMSSVWRNRCISDTYEPGSTFKALTTAIALEENLTNEGEEFSDEPIQVSDIDTISCWMQKSYSYNHGTESLLSAFENSCNPIFVQLAYRIGLTKYYNYVHTFGFYEVTGVDLPAEGLGIFHDNPSQIDLASLSFGESSTVTAIQLLNSYCAIINGGNLMVPHVVKYITDEDGNIVDEIEPEVIRTIFSEQTCARVRAMMEAVVTDGTGSAGQVPGYSVAGKTSTSTIEIGEEAGMHVLSFSCYAPSNDPQIAVLVVINRPEDRSVGSSSAASTAARIVEGTLTYLGVPRVFTEDEYDDMVIRYWVQPVSGYPAAQASSVIGTNGISTIYGSSDMNSETLVGFTYPGTDASLYSTGIVVLYPEGATYDDMLTTTVPNLSGKSAVECINALRDCNLNCRIEGDVMGVCVSQSEPAVTEVYAGEIITVTLVDPASVTPTPTPAPVGDNGDGVIVSDDTESTAETEVN